MLSNYNHNKNEIQKFFKKQAQNGVISDDGAQVGFNCSNCYTSKNLLDTKITTARVNFLATVKYKT
jgi:hypothetical protein